MKHDSLQEELSRHLNHCLECGLCVQECGFLQQYGTPKAIAEAYQPQSATWQRIGFECSLCGLCAQVCPPEIGLNPGAMFLAMRREAIQGGAAPFPQHKGILGYEKRGSSRRYSWYGLPEGCDTVFFPGCTFPGTRPTRTMQVFQHLQRSIPNLGIVLDCCTKPSHDLGREDFFQEMFAELRDYLLAHGVGRVLVVCPNCYQVFKEYGGTLAVQTVYELLVEPEFRLKSGELSGQVTVHDPCSARKNSLLHGVIRKLIGTSTLQVSEMKHHGENTLCCGEGGSAGCLNRSLAEGWGDLRRQEAGEQKVVTYCAGCVHYLGSRMDTVHILDLLFAPEQAMEKKVRVSKAPMTYLNRLLLKRTLKKKGILLPVVERERTFTFSQKQ